MGIQLDWEIDAERQASDHQYQEDPTKKSRRVRKLIQFIGFIIIVVALAALVLWGISQRLNDVNTQLETLLSDTVRSEVAAIRIGDMTTFLSLQRSASDDWRLAQQTEFSRYQALKVDTDIQLTGRIADVVVDGQRGRVQVEEIVEGVPYLRTWFYWFYDGDSIDGTKLPDKWYHVPPDFTFWGEDNMLTNNQFVVRYQSLDEKFAGQLNDQFTNWFSSMCGIADCTSLPPFTVDIIANNLTGAVWTDEQTQWQMIVPSPYVGIAREDMPFDIDYRIDTATLLANRFVDHIVATPQYPADVYYLRSALVSWLVGRFVQIDTNTFLLSSLASNYGQDAMSRLVSRMTPDASMAIFADVLGLLSLADANLDWRDFLTWRMVTENDLMARGDQMGFLSLYDMRLADVSEIAYERFNTAQLMANPVVIHVEQRNAPDGTPQLLATVQFGDGSQQTVAFNLVNNIWLRAS